MKRTPLPPGKPLQRTAQLDRSSRLRRTALIRSATALAVRPRKRAPGEFSGRARLLMWTRWGGACCVCGRSLPRRGWTAQHRRARGAGGTSDPVAASVPNGLAVHELPCHRRIEDNPTWALHYGYRIPQGADPLGWPVTLWDGRRIRLTSDGGYVALTLEEDR